MGVLQRTSALLTELEGLARLLPGLPMLNPFAQWSCARLLQQRAIEAPNQVALAYERERWTWKQLEERANQYAHFAIKQRVRRGQVVALLMDNRPDYLCAVTGLNRAGAITALINTHVTGAVLVHAVNAAKAKAVLVGSEHVATLEAVLPQLRGITTEHVWIRSDPASGDGSSGRRLMDEELLACSNEDPARRPLPGTTEPMCYIYTSGTTGLPKAAIVSNQRWIEAALMFGFGLGEMTSKDVLYMALPLYHSNGMCGGWGAALVSGATLALRRRFSASRFWDDMHEYGATVFVYIGEFCRYLLNQPIAPTERHHHLRMCMGNGLRPDIWKRFQSRFHIPLIREFYGATEGNVPLFNLQGRPGMIGRLHPGVAIVKCNPVSGDLVRDARGHCVSVDVGGHGLLLGHINPLTRFDGYLDRAATRQKIVLNIFRTGDRYFNTGDLVQLHEDGWISFTDRIGDTFRWKGENVSTHQVAEILNGVKGVREANVYGVRINGAEGRAGMASMVISDDFDLNGFARHVIANLARYQRPYFLRFVPEMQVTGTLKHQKHAYRAEGYDPTLVRDPLYYLDGGRYVRLDAALYRRIASGEIRPG